MVGEASSQEGFMQQAQMYLSHPQAILMSTEVWVMLGCLALLIAFNVWWLWGKE